MAKRKTLFLCENCGHTEPKWLGKCPSCGEWNTLLETESTAGGSRSSAAQKTAKPVRAAALASISSDGRPFLETAIREFDRILGGGIVKGSSVLIGGEPGIGKSTLVLQIAGAVSPKQSVLYVSGEESPEQIKRRADRLGIKGESISLLHASDIEQILTVLNKSNPDLLLIDSVQTLLSAELGAIPGTVNQIKFCCYECITWAKEKGGAVVFIGHVTKEGAIAGPKVIEHMVDTVLYFEYGAADLRVLRATKNRFGSVDEIGLFSMKERGLEEVKDPSRLLIHSRNGPPPAGITVAAVFEGSRVLLIEIQALVVPSQGSISRVFSEGIERNKISRIAAVLEKNLKLRFSDQDVYIHVGGGLKIGEIGTDLSIAMALYSARTDLPVPPDTVISGEISLAGEIRPTPHLIRKMKTAAEAGFTRFLSPPAEKNNGIPKVPAWLTAGSLAEAVRQIFQKGTGNK
jgi:DNA repair protein RadA/Sms